MLGAVTAFLIAVNWMRIELKKINNYEENNFEPVTQN
jgi:hypothetical protein